MQNIEVVVRKRNNYIFPPSIPKPRGNRQINAQFVISIIFIAVSQCFANNNFFIIEASLCNYFIFFLIAYLIRVSEIFEEYEHLSSRYANSVFYMLKHIFSSNLLNFIPMLGIMFLYVYSERFLVTICDKNKFAYVLNMIGVGIFVNIIKMNESPLTHDKLLDELNDLHYGSGMSYSFYHGYLKHILPCHGDERKGLREHMETYEAENLVKFASKKLYIFIPFSAHCPTSLEKAGLNIHEAKTLRWNRRDRAGVKNREYHNSVYKIETEDNFVYVCAEFASPLLTYREVMNHNIGDSVDYKRYRPAVVTKFYLTLSKILNSDPDCRDLCELIFYNDLDEHGQLLKIDISKILLEKIEQDQN